MAKGKADFWKSDWFLGLVIALAFFVAAYPYGSEVLRSIERKAYDWGVAASNKTPNDKIAVIAIDNESIKNIGRWPWSREVHAKMTDILVGAKARVIGNSVQFFEPQQDPGLAYINKLLAAYNKAVPAASAGTPGAADAIAPGVDFAQFGTLLKEADTALNTDRKLASSFAAANNVVLSTDLTVGEPRGKPDKDLPAFVAKFTLVDKKGADIIPTNQIQFPIESLGSVAAGLGHLTQTQDPDGAIRTEPLLLQYYDRYVPSFALMVAAKSLNLGVDDIKVTWGEQLRLGKLAITTDSSSRMFSFFYKDRGDKRAFQIDSFYDVISGKINAAERYAGKIVLIGATASGVGTSFVTPVSSALTPVEISAHTVSSILSEHFFVTPAWAVWLELVVFLLVAAYLIALLPKQLVPQARSSKSRYAPRECVPHVHVQIGRASCRERV